VELSFSPHTSWGSDALLNLNPIAHHPKLELDELLLPAHLELLLHPLAILCRVGHIDYDLYQIISIDDTSVTPMTFDLLSLIAGCAKVIYDFQHRVSQPFRGYFSTVVELEWK
jgi:hypothetical protein